MTYSSQISLGHISKVHGYEGFVVVRLEKRFIGNYHEQESVFLEIEGRPVPFFIEEFYFSGGDIVRLKFEGYDTTPSVEEFIGCRVMMTNDDSGADGETGIPTLEGYTVITTNGTLLGTIIEIIDNTLQYLLVVKGASGGEILVPLHEDLIEKIDEEGRRLVLDVPEELITIND